MIDLNLRRRLQGSTQRKNLRTPGRLAMAAGRADFALEQVEARLMLSGDHPSLPVPWTPMPSATAVSLDTASAATLAARGRGSADGIMLSGDPGDLFSFVVTGAPGRTRDFVSILADTSAVTANDGNNGLPNNGLKLDTYLEIYNSAGVLIQSGADNGSGAGLAGAVTVGLNSLLPPSQRAPDGWLGFEGVVGDTYYVRVRADPNVISGRSNVGRYTLKIDGATIEQAVNQDPDQVIMGVTVPNIDFGRAFAEDNIDEVQRDIIYRVTTPDDARFSGLATFQAISDADLNPHVELFSIGNSSGAVQRLATVGSPGTELEFAL